MQPTIIASYASADGKDYKNFAVATCATVRDVVLPMNDPAYLTSRWQGISKYFKYGKIYLETSRDMIVPDQAE